MFFLPQEDISTTSALAKAKCFRICAILVILLTTLLYILVAMDVVTMIVWNSRFVEFKLLFRMLAILLVTLYINEVSPSNVRYVNTEQVFQNLGPTTTITNTNAIDHQVRNEQEQGHPLYGHHYDYH